MSNELSPLALALGRIPTGLYVVSTLHDGVPLAFVGSLLVQVGFDPPTLAVAIGKGREHLAAIRARGGFAVSVLDDASRHLMSPFFQRHEPGRSPFDRVAHRDSPGGLPVLTGALAWLECRVSGEHATGDHTVLFGVVEHAEILRPGDPTVHLRKNGLAY
jgi:flavin reductase (DIM6/NTAB) family NADH-FMN oxidoreductase RutF